MVTESKIGRREPKLSPTHWPGLPRGRTLLRATLVAALLALAAGVLYAREPQPTCPAAATEAGSAGASPDLSPTPTGATPGLPLPAGAVGVPIRLAEPAALAVVRPGLRVDLLAVPATAGGTATSARPTLVAARALVLDVVGAGAVGTEAAGGASALYLALQPDQAHRAISMPEGYRFAIMVRP